MEQRVTKSETWQKQLVKHVIPGGGLWPGWNPSFNSVELRMSHSISSSLSFPIWYMRGKIVHKLAIRNPEATAIFSFSFAVYVPMWINPFLFTFSLLMSTTFPLLFKCVNYIGT